MMDLKNIFSIAKIIASNGGRLYLVGGAVRDEIMGLIPSDFDFCVTGLSEEHFTFLFPMARKVGKFFPVFYIKNYEFALARKEKKIANGHSGFQIEATNKITILEDLKRRDFTMNAIAKDVLTGVFIDPFDGAKDIARHIIRHISPSFTEDPLRVYRAARFATTFHFSIHQATLKLMKSLKRELPSLSKERIFNELDRSLAADTPSIFFNVLKEAEILDVHFKELSDLIGVPQPIKYHPEGDVYNHTMIVLDKVAKITNENSTRYCALTHDFGKALTPKEILPKHIGHEKNGIKLVQDFSDKLSVPKVWKKKAVIVVSYHMKASICNEMKPSTFVRFIHEIHHSPLSLDELEIIVHCDDMLGRETAKFSVIGNKMLQEVSGKSLIKSGIMPNEIGTNQFKEMLLNKQIEFIKEYKNKIR